MLSRDGIDLCDFLPMIIINPSVPVPLCSAYPPPSCSCVLFGCSLLFYPFPHPLPSSSLPCPPIQFPYPPFTLSHPPPVRRPSAPSCPPPSPLTPTSTPPLPPSQSARPPFFHILLASEYCLAQCHKPYYLDQFSCVYSSSLRCACSQLNNLCLQ